MQHFGEVTFVPGQAFDGVQGGHSHGDLSQGDSDLGTGFQNFPFVAQGLDGFDVVALCLFGVSAPVLRQSLNHTRRCHRTQNGADVAYRPARPRFPQFGGVAVETPDHERALLAKLPVTEIAGIASRRARTLEPYGIKTCLDLRNAKGSLIEQLLTATGHDIWEELNGNRVIPIRPKRPRHKMIFRGGSLAGHFSDPLTLYGWLARNVERLVEELHYHEVRPSVLTVYMSYFEGGTSRGVVHLDVLTDRFGVLLEAAKAGLRQVWHAGSSATHLHLERFPILCSGHSEDSSQNMALVYATPMREPL